MGLKRIILRKFSVRAHLMIILAGTFAAGAFVGRLFLWLGMTTMQKRFFITAPVSYIVFFVLIRVWIDYVRAGIVHHAGIEAGDEEPPKSFSSARALKDSGEHEWRWFDFLESFDEFALIILCGLAIAALVGWIFTDGPLILVDAAFEALVAAGFARSARGALDPDWKDKVFLKTIGPFLFIWLLGAFALTYVDAVCPGHSRLSEALHSCDNKP